MNEEDEKLARMIKAIDTPYIDDDGFTARVVGALPVRGSAASRRRTLLLCSSGALSLLLMAALGGQGLWASLMLGLQWLVLEPVLTIGMQEYTVSALLALGGGLAASVWLSAGSLRGLRF